MHLHHINKIHNLQASPQIVPTIKKILPQKLLMGEPFYILIFLFCFSITD